MSVAKPPPDTCKWCGESLPQQADRCPLCGRPASAGPSPVRDEGPLTPAPGQEPFGSWANIKHTIQADKAFGVVLVLLAIEVVLSSLSGSYFHVFVSLVVLWGVLTFRWWGLWLALFGSGLGALLGIAVLFAGLEQGGLIALVSALPLAINGFVLVVLYTRRDAFD